MLKRFLVLILLLLTAGFALAQDMPPLPSDAPPSAVPAKDDTMPALPDAAPATAPAIVAPVSAAVPSANDMPALPDTGVAPAASDVPALPGAASSAPADNSMPALPDAAASAAPATAPAASSDMPALPSTSAAAPAATDSGMPALPDASAPAMAPASSDMPALPSSSTSAAPAVAAPAPATTTAAKVSIAKSVHVRHPWEESKIRPDTILGGWIQAKGGNITSRLSWGSQQVLNGMDAKKYKMANEEGVYEGEQNKGPQYRKFTFVVPGSKDFVFVLLKQVGRKMWLRVGPDEEPAFANHSYAAVAKIREEDLTVLHILKAKFGARMAPHHMVPSWAAKFDRQRETADE
jgi:hypothetical protein